MHHCVVTGTTVTASGLFKNFPVRRNYYSSSLKRCRTELQDVTSYLVAFALVRPLVRLTLRHNKEIVWTKVAASDVRQALMHVIGSPAVAAMRQVQKTYDTPVRTV
jgi:DNA mismatch repair ATPase MutL